MTIALINDDKALTRLNKLAHSQLGRGGATLHQAAFNHLHRIEANGDIRGLVHLYDGLPARAKVALRAWAVAFGRVRWSEKRGFSYAKTGTTDFAGAEANPPLDWQKQKAPRQTHAFNLKAEIEALIKRAEKNNCGGTPMIRLIAAYKAA